MRRQLGQVAVLTLAIGLATWWIGWWTVPLVGAAWGAARPGERFAVATAGLAASLAWVLLLALTAARGPVGGLSRKLGETLGVPGWVPLLATLAFPAILAASAAALAGSVQRRTS